MESFFSNRVLFSETTLNMLHFNAGAWFDFIMITVTSMGSGLFCMVLFPPVYWCYSRGIALKVAVIFLVSTTVNHSLKDYFAIARPDPRLMESGLRELAPRHMPRGPAFPSGHTQSAVSLWAPAIFFMRKKLVAAIGIALMILVPYSRLYLGVHFLGDIAGGYAFAFICIVVVIPLIIMAEGYYRRVREAILLVALLAVPFGAYHLVPGYNINGIMGILSGLLMGALLAEGRIDFHPANSLKAQAMKLLIGFAGLIIIWVGLKRLLPDLPATGFFRNWAAGFWCTFAAPLVFTRAEILKGHACGTDGADDSLFP